LSGAPPRRIALATHSAHKARELRELLAGAPAAFVSLAELGVTTDLPEDGATFEENAVAKARGYAALTGLPTLADDSGLEVEALSGGPGIRTRRYAGEDATDAENNAKLLAALDGLPPERRGARYVCVLALAEPAWGGGVVTMRGECRGRIAAAPRGDNGFGYDPIFEPEQEPPGGRTLGEWSAQEKNRISHRAKAAEAMRRHLAARQR
jgi:XTP/dITP diphosphohydrolase